MSKVIGHDFITQQVTLAMRQHKVYLYYGYDGQGNCYHNPDVHFRSISSVISVVVG